MRALQFAFVRIGSALLLVLAVLVFAFSLLHLAPGDPAMAIAGESADAATLEEVRRSYGLDRPFAEQLLGYVGRFVRGDFGQSLYFNAPVSRLVLERVPATLLLVGTAIGFAVVVGTALGATAARRPHGALSALISAVAVAGFAAPVFWTGIVLVQLFASHWPLFPVNGMLDVSRARPGALGRAADVAHHLVLPALSLSLFYLAQYSRLARATMLDALSADYVRTARAKGLPEGLVVRRHALRNAVLPLLTVLGVQVGQIFAGAVLVETVFAWPGLGTLAFEAILRRDTPVLLGILAFSAVLVAATNVVVDLLYRAIDPRVDASGTA